MSLRQRVRVERFSGVPAQAGVSNWGHAARGATPHPPELALSVPFPLSARAIGTSLEIYRGRRLVSGARGSKRSFEREGSQEHRAAQRQGLLFDTQRARVGIEQLEKAPAAFAIGQLGDAAHRFRVQ